MGKVIRVLAAASVLMALTGCGTIYDRSNDYLNEPEGKPLRIPEVYERDRISVRYPVPDVDNPVVVVPEERIPPPPTGNDNLLAEPFAIEEMDGVQWLWVNNTPARVWPMLDKFLQSRGMEAEFEDIGSGVIQSSVMESGKLSATYAESLGLDKTGLHVLVLRLNQGVKRNSSEVQARVATVDGLRAKALPWFEESQNKPVERQVLEDLRVYMENNQDDKAFSLVAQEIGGASKVSLVAEGESAFLRFDLGFDRGWGAVSRALRNVGLTVRDVDRSQGTFYVIYDDGDSDGSWLESLLGREKRRDANIVLHLARKKGYLTLNVNRVDGTSLSRDEKIKILTLILENVS